MREISKLKSLNNLFTDKGTNPNNSIHASATDVSSKWRLMRKNHEPLFLSIILDIINSVQYS